MDECTFKLEPHIVRGWFAKGSKPTVKYVANKFQKLHVFGALGINTLTTKISPKINAKKYLPFIRRLHRKYKKLCIIIDNARWHLTKQVMQFVDSKGIKMIRILPYSPELNPIEQYWKNVKQWLGLKPIFTKDDLVKELKKALRKNTFMPKISDY